MTKFGRACAGALLLIASIVPVPLHADTVQVTVHDGRVSIATTSATPAQILDAWGRAGGILFVNAERITGAPIALQLEEVPEEQALDVLLRSVSGYLARRRVGAGAGTSIFDRIVVLPAPAVARNTVVQPAPAAPASPAGANSQAPVFTPPRPPAAAAPPPQPPAGIPQGPGVVRLVGADGQPVEDDQAGAPPPQPQQAQPQPYNPGDAAPRPPFAPPPRPPSPPASQPSPGAPVGVPTPGMPVPVPNAPGQAPR
jgi:hypothetical protein